MSFSFTLEKKVGKARVGKFQTSHGEVRTPMFMPVGTVGTVKALDTQDVEKTKAQIILANTYHLYLRPGMEKLQQMGGIHQFMGWDKPILTDSGGFQVFSLSSKNQGQNGQTQDLVTISDEGAKFVSHLDGSKHFFSPEKAIEIQRQIGADIIMAFDECTPDGASLDYARQALDRTHQWAERCQAYWQEHDKKSVYGTYQALFGIVQGAKHRELRVESATKMTSLDFDGIAVGGETIGYNMEGTVEVMGWIEDLLPDDKPRYAMGLGRDPQNIIDAVWAGFDMFDCVAPTRLARNGSLYCGQVDFGGTGGKPNCGQPVFRSKYGEKGRLQIGNAQFAADPNPIQSDCDCATCSAGYSRAYLHHLFKTKELTYYRLASIHNVRFMTRLCEQIQTYLLDLE